MFPARKCYSVLVVAVLITISAAIVSRKAVAPGTPDHPALSQAPDVDVAAVIVKRVTDWQTYSGRLEAVEKVDVRPLVSGTIVAIHFQDGTLVKKGDPLFTIDPRPYAAQVDRAVAQLSAAQAQDAYANRELTRGQRLLASNSISRRDYDELENAVRSAAANVSAARASVESTRLNLSFTRISAPVAGRVSRAEVTVGNVVSAGADAAVLTTLVSVAPIYVAFDVDEQTYLRQMSRHDGGVLPVLLGLADEPGYPRQGEIVSVDNRLDPASGTIRVRARFDNRDDRLVPGLFARIKIGGKEPHVALMIDEGAIGTDQEKRFVLIVDDSNRAQYREIRAGSLEGSLRIITSGLNPGDRIIVNGLQRVRPGGLVRPTVVQMDRSTQDSLARQF